MWCPEGYVTLFDLSSIIDSVADENFARMEVDFGPPVSQDSLEYVPEEFWPDFWQLEKLLSCRSEQNLQTAKAIVFQPWLIGAALANLDAYVCSPTGKIMSVADVFFHHEARFVHSLWDKWLSDPFIRHAVHQVAFARVPRSPMDGFISFSYPSGIICECSEIAAARWGALANEDIILVHKNFSGWSICFKSDDAPKDATELLSLVGLSFQEYLYDPESATTDPLKFVHECVLSAFPRCKDTTRDNVQITTGYSRRSIERALKKYGGRDWWAKGGQTEV